MDSHRVCSGERIIRFSSPIDAVDQLLLEISSSSVGNSLEKLIDSRISQSKVDAVDRALKLGNALVETAKRSTKKLETKHNAETWTLPADLTAKVFSMLDTRSLCQAAATCYLLSKCANNPSCYANIDLTLDVPKVDDALVCKFIQRAGKNLKSLKLGLLPSQNLGVLSELPLHESYTWNKKNQNHSSESSLLTRACLLRLTMGGEKAGSLLRSLHLYNINTIDTPALCAVLSVCRSLLDLEVVGMQFKLSQTLECISSNCHLMERLVLKSSRNGEIRIRDMHLKSKICHGLVKSCPNMYSLSLLGFKINDHQARILMKGLLKLKFVDFSKSRAFRGSFLRNLGGPGYVLEHLILRDCPHLEETKVADLLAGLLAGDFKLLRTLDISNKNGLADASNFYQRCYNKRNLPLAQLEAERLGLVIRADFPVDQRDEYSDETEESEDYSEESDPFNLGSSSEISEFGSLHEEPNIPGYFEGPDDSDFDFMW